MDLGKLYAVCRDNQNTVNLIGMALVCTLVLSGYIQTLLINTCIFSYLSYRTMKFLSTCQENSTDINQLIKFLKYWTGFSMLIVFEYILGCVFSFFFMSVFYNALKLVGFAMLLQNNESLLMLYGLIVIPLFNKYESYMDQVFVLLETKAQNFRSTAGNENINYNIYSYVEPYINKVLTLSGQGKGMKKKEE